MEKHINSAAEQQDAILEGKQVQHKYEHTTQQLSAIVGINTKTSANRTKKVFFLAFKLAKFVTNACLITYLHITCFIFNNTVVQDYPIIKLLNVTCSSVNKYR